MFSARSKVSLCLLTKKKEVSFFFPEGDFLLVLEGDLLRVLEIHGEYDLLPAQLLLVVEGDFLCVLKGHGEPDLLLRGKENHLP